jgi:23S rRNA (guanosine2251-2'-O)-methyltransferase
MYLYGKNSILERLKSNPKTIKIVYLEESLRAPQIEKLVKVNSLIFRRLPQSKLQKIKNAQNLQGIIAEVNDFQYKDFDDLINEGPKPALIFLDRLYDPQNLGAIMRTAAGFGGFSIIIPKYQACRITETVLHVAQGAENYTRVSLVSNLSNAVIAAKKQGYWILGACLEEISQNLQELSIPFPVGLVLGSEGAGLRWGVSKLIDIKVKIPMPGASLSYNVSIAGSIFCYEINRQRNEYGKKNN